MVTCQNTQKYEGRISDKTMKKLGHYNLIQTESGFHSTLCAGNNKVILTSTQVHKTSNEWRADADIDFCQELGIDKNTFIDRRESKDGKNYFCVCMNMFSNGEPTGTFHDYYKSETYNSKSSMEKGIQSVINNAKTTDVRVVDRRKK